MQDAVEVAADPQAAECWVDVPLSARDEAAGRTLVRQVASPVDFFGTDSTPLASTPALGEHTEEVLAGLGLAPAQLGAVLATARAAADAAAANAAKAEAAKQKAVAAKKAAQQPQSKL